MKNILFTFFLVVALIACKEQPLNESGEPLTETVEVNNRDSALLSQSDIMVLYYHGYMSAINHSNDGGTLEERWVRDSLYFVKKVKPLMIK